MTGHLEERRKGRRYSTLHAAYQLDRALGGELPDGQTVHKIVSLGEVSALGFIRYVGERTVIRHMDIATFRVGPQALRLLRDFADGGRIEDARIVVAHVMKNDKRKESAIGYWYELGRLCEEHGWELAVRENHAKLALFDTDDGKFVLEGSCNLNEAPNFEAFSFEKDADLYDFYAGAVGEMIAGAGKTEG